MSRSLRSINCENVRDGTGGWIFLWKSKPRVSFARQKGWVEQFLRWDFGLQTKIASDSSWGFPFFVAGSVTPLKIPTFSMHRFSATEHCRQLARCTTWEKAQRKPPKLRSFTDKLLTRIVAFRVIRSYDEEPYSSYEANAMSQGFGPLLICWSQDPQESIIWRWSWVLKVPWLFEQHCRVSNSTSRPLSSEKVPPQQSFEVKNITILHFHEGK